MEDAYIMQGRKNRWIKYFGFKSHRWKVNAGMGIREIFSKNVN
jgi:hypothetical protein